MRATAATAAVLAVTAGSVVHAQASPYIPDGISSKCSTYLASLDANAGLASCSSALLAATNLFNPATSASTVSDSTIKSTLGNLCRAQCDKSVVQSALSSFATECANELSSGQSLIKSNYDVLYLLSPFTSAVCTKNDVGDYCALTIGQVPASASSSSTASASVSGGQQLLVQTGSYKIPRIDMSDLYISITDVASDVLSRVRGKRQAVSSSASIAVSSSSSLSSSAPAASTSAAGTAPAISRAGPAITPNSTTFRNAGVPFLMLDGKMSSNVLCTTCTRNILAAYVSFETQFPYASGLSSSPMLKSQIELWTDIGGVCGSGFLSAITNQAGGNVNGAASHFFGKQQAFIALGAGVFAAFTLL